MATDTKTTLLDHAEQIVRARGFDGFSYADLAEAVGIRKASIHYHFPTKAGLSGELMDRYTATIEGMCKDIKSSNVLASGQLLGLIELYRYALNEGETLCLCVSLTSSHQSLSADVNARISGFRTMMVGWIKGVFELGLQDKSIASIADPELEGHACLALLEGAHLAARAKEDINLFDRAVAILKARCQPLAVA